MQKQSPPSPNVLPLPIIVSEAFSSAASAVATSMKEAHQHFSVHSIPSHGLSGEGDAHRGETISIIKCA